MSDTEFQTQVLIELTEIKTKLSERDKLCEIHTKEMKDLNTEIFGGNINGHKRIGIREDLRTVERKIKSITSGISLAVSTGWTLALNYFLKK